MRKEPRCGQIWYAQGGGDYLGKGRPVLILQNDEFLELDSIVVVPFTTNSSSEFDPLFRMPLEVSPLNGLMTKSWLMIDKLQAVRHTRLKRELGRLTEDELAQVIERAMPFLLCPASVPSWRLRLMRILRFGS